MASRFERELCQQNGPCKTGVRNGRYLFIADLGTQRSRGVADVYVIDGRRDTSYTPDEVFNLARSIYPDVFSDASRTILKGFPPQVEFTESSKEGKCLPCKEVVQWPIQM